MQFGSLGTIESQVGALVLPLPIEIAGWDDLTGKTLTATWRALDSSRVEFQVSSAGSFLVADDAENFTLSPAASPIQGTTPTEAGKRGTWGDLPAGSYAFKLYIADPGADAEVGFVARWEHRAPQYVGSVESELEPAVSIDTVGATVTATVSTSPLGLNADQFVLQSGIYFLRLLVRQVISVNANSAGVGFYRITSAGVVLTFTSADVANAAFICAVKNESVGLVTLATEGAETIEGLASLPLGSGSAVWLYSDGTNLRQIMP